MVLAVVVVGAGAIALRSRRAPSAPPIKSAVVADAKPDAPVPPTVSAAPAKSVAPGPKSPVPSNKVSLKGLCQYQADSGSGAALITPYSLQRLALTGQSARYLALPAIHGACWKSRVGLTRARIVSYDRQVDQAYHYYGDLEISLKFVGEYPDLQSFVSQNKIPIKSFGFSSIKDFADALVVDGAVVNEPLQVFQVEKAKFPRARDPVGQFSFYPGVRLISARDATEGLQRKSMVWVDVRVNSRKIAPLTGAIDVTEAKLDEIAITIASAAVAQVKDLKNSLLPMDKELALIGNDLSDRSPFNLVPALRAAGYSRVAVVEGGASALAGFRTATPVSVAGMKVISSADLAKGLESYVAIDVREGQQASNWIFKNSFEAPVRIGIKQNELFRDFTNFQTTGRLARDYRVRQQLNIKAIVAAAAKKPILLIGANELDWRPILVFEELKKNGVQSVYWFRSGMELLGVERLLGVLEPRILRGIDRATSIRALPASPQATFVKVVPVKRTRRSFTRKYIPGVD